MNQGSGKVSGFGMSFDMVECEIEVPWWWLPWRARRWQRVTRQGNGMLKWFYVFFRISYTTLQQGFPSSFTEISWKFHQWMALKILYWEMAGWCSWEPSSVEQCSLWIHFSNLALRRESWGLSLRLPISAPTSTSSTTSTWTSYLYLVSPSAHLRASRFYHDHLHRSLFIIQHWFIVSHSTIHHLSFTIWIIHLSSFYEFIHPRAADFLLWWVFAGPWCWVLPPADGRRVWVRWFSTMKGSSASVQVVLPCLHLHRSSVSPKMAFLKFSTALRDSIHHVRFQ